MHEQPTSSATGAKTRVRVLAMYLRPLRYECERFLRRACCHEHAFTIWRNWQPLRDHVMPHIDANTAPPGFELNMLGVLHMTGEVFKLNAAMSDDQKAIDGTLIDDIVARVGGQGHMAVMHEFVLAPLLPPQKKAPRRRKTKAEPAVNVWVKAKGEVN